MLHRFWLTSVLCFVCVLVSTFSAFADEVDEVVFQLGRPDAMSAEFSGWVDFEKVKENTAAPFKQFVVGKNITREWCPFHPSTRDFRNAGLQFTSEIIFDAVRDYNEPLFFVVGVAYAHPTEPSLYKVTINGTPLTPTRAPVGDQRNGFKGDTDIGVFESIVIEVPAGTVKRGRNTLSIVLEDGSWIHYDYLRLSTSNVIPERLPPRDLKTEFARGAMRDARKILYVVRKPGIDVHWYANFGYYAKDEDVYPFHPHGGASLRIRDIDSGDEKIVFEDNGGSIRDPQIHYDGERILFSYLPAGKLHYNLYEINIDGTNLRQITSGDWDDIEPTYLPDGDIVFCSSRARRWVQCWLTQVATIHRCGPNGENIRELSCNPEQDNTPWVLPNGQLLYMRWEYVDRSQVDYHHLWTMNPDGTKQMVFFGNQRPGIVMLGAKPIPNSEKVVAIFSPGHGIREHYGNLTIVDPRNGPDDHESAKMLTTHNNAADPWAFSEDEFLVARQDRVCLVDGGGFEQTLFALPSDLKDAGFWIHEPRPVIKRERENIISDQTDLTADTGRLILVDVYQGRRMQDVQRGLIKELLVLESLPEPVHFQGGMDQISLGGTFTLERILGTIPVAEDGSALMELPALRSLFFVAMDHDGRPVKRMHSFTSVMPGETNVCIGCHEPRTQTPNFDRIHHLTTSNRPFVSPQKIEGIPEVYDFARDIQPILDKHCLECHNNDRMDGGVNLSGDWGPLYSFSYMNLSHRNLFGDNRNRAVSNFAPYEIGSSASRLVKLIEEEHAGAKLSESEQKTIRYWIDAGANYAGTYAANASGMIGWVYSGPYSDHYVVENDAEWPETKGMTEALALRCGACHGSGKAGTLPPKMSSDGQISRNWVFNLTEPVKSRLLRAPLATDAGGFGRCKYGADAGENAGKPVFASTDDADYQTILAGIERGRYYITKESPRVGTVPFWANRAYTREMIRYGVLPADHDFKAPLDPFATDRAYWEALQWQPK
ncbi:MAG: polysaccharide lyase family protein [Thermoguttaceae bacterium]